MLNKIRQSIACRLFLVVFIFSLLLTLLLAGAQSYFNYRKGVASIDENFEQIERGRLKAITESLWVMDRGLLQAQLNGILNTGHVNFAKIEYRNLLIASAGVPVGAADRYREFPMYRMYDNRRIYIGTLTVGAGFNDMLEGLKRNIWRALLYYGIQVFLISLFVFFLFQFYVTRHLARMAAYFRKQNPRESGRLVLEGPGASNNDEIGQVVAAINTMSGNVRRAFSALETELQGRRQAEDSLMLFSQAVEQSPVTIIITDTEGNIEYTNPKFSQLTGYLSGEAMGKKPLFLQAGELAEEAHEQLWATITAGRVWSGEIRNRKKSGEVFWESATISPIRNKGGEITHFVVIKEDITERKQLEAQLRQAQKMEAVGQLAGGIAHDFNNILSTIIGYGHLVRDRMGGEDPLRVNVEQILESAEKAAEVSHGLLAFSRKQVISPRPVSINEIVRQFDKLICRVIGEDIELKYALTERDPIVMADVAQLEQVLMNLATNARDAMPGGGRFIVSTDVTGIDDGFIKAHGFGEPGRYAVVAVSDTGAGMDKKTKAKIFEPFFTTKEIGKGTGLGLAMAYGIIKQHDGFINVYSEPGKGTTFKIYLPVTGIKAAALAAEVAVSGPVRGTETILVTEDDDRLRKLLEIILRESGYTVILAEDGEDAINKFEENREKIGLVILDMIMPRKSGKEACEAIRGMRPGIKVIFLSGYTADRIENNKLSGEGFSFLTKPVSPRDLLRRVREMLDKK